MRPWLLLTYKIPREPTAGRVSIWRKLQKLGAVLLHDAIWVLPATATTGHQFQWLAAEIREMKGEANVWRCGQAMEGGDDHLVQLFTRRSDTEYRAILEQLRARGADRSAAARRYQQVCATDYFHSPLGDKVRQALTRLDATARKRKGGSP